MLAGTVPRGKRGSHDAHHAAHSHNLSPFPFDHVFQDVLCERDRAEVVKFHYRAVDVQVCVHEQGALGTSTIVDQNINLGKDTAINKYSTFSLIFALPQAIVN